MKHDKWRSIPISRLRDICRAYNLSNDLHITADWEGNLLVLQLGNGNITLIGRIDVGEEIYYPEKPHDQG